VSRRSDRRRSGCGGAVTEEVPAQLDVRTIAYVAGIVDARGRIEVNNRHGRPQPRIRVTTRRAELLRWLAQVTGVKVVEDDRGYERRPCGEHCASRHSHAVRQSAQWTVDSSRATVVLFNVQPFVVCQVAEVAAALRYGLEAFPPARGDVAKQMAALGWSLPTAPGSAS